MMMSIDGSRDWYIIMWYEASVGALVTAREVRTRPAYESCNKLE